MSIELHRVNFKNHFMIKHAYDMQCVARPLKRLGDINHFTYFKLSNVQHQKAGTILTTHPSYTIDVFFPEKLHEIAFFGNIQDYKDGFYLWDFFKGNIITQAAMQHLGLMNGLTIIKKHNHDCEFYCFATANKNPTINHLFINHLDFFEAFILWFKEKTHKLLLLSERHRIIMPQNAGDKTIIPVQNDFKHFNENINSDNLNSFTDQLTHQHLLTMAEDEFVNFYMANKKVSPTLVLKTPLSKREQQCAHYLLQGMTAKEIAAELQISHRTVEVYFERLKKRLDCKNKLQLVKRLTEFDYTHNV